MSKPLKFKFGNDLSTEVEIIQMAYEKAENYKGKQKREYLDSIKSLFSEHKMKDRIKTIYTPSIGVVLLIGIVILAYLTPFPSKFQTGVLWGALCLIAAACAAAIPGFFEFRLKNVVRATGAIAVFAFMYTNSPDIIEKTMNDSSKHIAIQLVQEDSKEVHSLNAEFNPNNTKSIVEELTNTINSYYGTNYSPEHFVFYRKSDGRIYAEESCNQIKEYSILIIPSNIVKNFGNKRVAYLKYKNLK